MIMTPLDALPAGSGSFPTFASVNLIDSVGILILVIVIAGVLWRYFLWKRVTPPNYFKAARSSLGYGKLAGTFFSELLNRVMLQRDLINKDNLRRFTHLSMVWGFIGLSLTTTLSYIFNESSNYVPFTGNSLSPIRWLGNLSGAIMLVGATIAIFRLILVPMYRRGRSFSDVWFTFLLFLGGLTGFITEYWGDVAYAANPNVLPAPAYGISFSASILIALPYAIHLGVIALLLVTAPISAFSHAVTVPSFRYVDRLGSLLAVRGNTVADQHRKFKEKAMLDQVMNLYESQKRDK